MYFFLQKAGVFFSDFLGLFLCLVGFVGFCFLTVKFSTVLKNYR